MLASSNHGPAARCGREIGMEYECDLNQIRNRLEQQVLLALPPFLRRGVARRIANVSFAGVGSRRDRLEGSSARGRAARPRGSIEIGRIVCLRGQEQQLW